MPGVLDLSGNLMSGPIPTTAETILDQTPKNAFTTCLKKASYSFP